MPMADASVDTRRFLLHRTRMYSSALAAWAIGSVFLYETTSSYALSQGTNFSPAQGGCYQH